MYRRLMLESFGTKWVGAQDDPTNKGRGAASDGARSQVRQREDAAGLNVENTGLRLIVSDNRAIRLSANRLGAGVAHSTALPMGFDGGAAVGGAGRGTQ